MKHLVVRFKGQAESLVIHGKNQDVNLGGDRRIIKVQHATFVKGRDTLELFATHIIRVGV